MHLRRILRDLGSVLLHNFKIFVSYVVPIFSFFAVSLIIALLVFTCSTVDISVALMPLGLSFSHAENRFIN